MLMSFTSLDYRIMNMDIAIIVLISTRKASVVFHMIIYTKNRRLTKKPTTTTAVDSIRMGLFFLLFLY